MEKVAIAVALDERGLLLADLVHRALSANDRVKYELSLLQTARAHADSPDTPAVDLSEERKRAGVAEVAFDSVATASVAHGETYAIPHARSVVEAAIADVDAMIAPLRVGGPSSATELFENRFRAFDVDDLVGPRDDMPRAALSRLTGSDRTAQDTLHLLVMDLHRELNRLEARLSTETIEGAKAFGLLPEDRPLVAAFASGVQRTATLKFDHPGLATTATRDGSRLILQNGIGETDAHVVLVRIEEARASVTATDVHLARLEFLRRLLEPLSIHWDELRERKITTLNAGDAFFVVTGTFVSSEAHSMESFLESLGASLVFLIDWNRARKQLQRFVPKAEAVAILLSAARETIGHRAFLEAGGDGLVFDAMAAVMRAPVRFGERLDDVLGGERATDFLRSVLREAKEAREEGRSRALLGERVRAELAAELAQAGERLLDPIQRHARITLDVATRLAAFLGRLAQGASDAPAETAAPAKQSEHDADAIVVETRRVVQRMSHAAAFQRIIETADDATDAIEEAAFHATLLPDHRGLRTDFAKSLHPLAEIVVAGARAYVSAVESARTATTLAARVEMRAFLDAVDRVTVLEREADDAERAVIACWMGAPVEDVRFLVLLLNVAHGLEAATDALALAALQLRDYATAVPFAH